MRGVVPARVVALGLVLAVTCWRGCGAADVEARVLLQSSPLAGFRHHDARMVWSELRVGDALDLQREPANPYDANAIRVDWRGHKLGYVPRMQNADIARQLDHGNRIEARISRLQMHRAPSRRIEFEIYAPL